ncbi:MAG: hypothetical protein AAFX99_14445 [Myxococcota bacterium]
MWPSTSPALCTRTLLVSCMGVAVLTALGCGDDTRQGSADTTLNNSDTAGRLPPLARCTTDRSVERVQLSPRVGSFAVGPCGRTAFTEIAADSTPTLRLSDPRRNTLELVAVGGRLPMFARTGDQLAYVAVDDEGQRVTAVRDLNTGAVATERGSGRMGFALDRSNPEAPHSTAWLCEDERLRVLGDDRTWTELDPGATCVDLHAAPGGVGLVRSDGNGGMRWTDLRGGSSMAVAGLQYIEGFIDSETEHRDGFLLSEDGTVLLHQVIRYTYCGDTVCEEPSSLTSVYDLKSNRFIADVVGAYLGDEPPLSGPQTTRDGHAMLFASHPNSSALRHGRALSVIEGARGEHLFADARQVFVSVPIPIEGQPFNDVLFGRVDLDTGEREDWLRAPGRLEAFGVSAHEQALAWCHFTRERITYPDRPNVSHTQVWAISTWSETDGVREAIATSSQPMEVFWVGDDGRVLVGGGLFTEPLPESAPQTPERSYGLHMIEPDGTIAATWENLGSVRDLVQVAPNRLLIERWENRQHLLEVLDLTTQQRTLVANGQRVEWALDDAVTLLVYSVLPPDDGTGEEPAAELWAVSLDRVE